MDIFLIIVVILFVLAISDLVVGVSNDAVNFLNSAIGSKVSSVKLIMIIASIGVLLGATFSSGMMEVARKGIFHPEQFFFAEIMIIFLAVMLTDIILLDMFNTFGLPTSTTVSIVFELLGAAVAVSILKISNNEDSIIQLGEYINTDKALLIITGIFLSIFIAFTIGAIIQYLSRLLFSFRYVRNVKYFGGVWGGVAITGITYFILIKGAKGSSFIQGETLEWIKHHTMLILLYSFIAWSLILQFANWIFKLNILKFIVFVGTFALAMAFAGNDLVNFIGVPLAGLKSYQAFLADPIVDPNQMTMTILNQSVKSNTILLLIAGGIMIVTLWFSKKARRVVKTSIDLSRQDEGEERFGSSAIARSIVRMALIVSNSFKKITPGRVSKGIQRRFEIADEHAKAKDAPAFDLIRASVNLVVASMLIAFGTSLKLPLSTTYVTFMVAMGTSLTDKAWGTESAVYRVTGVLTVIGGWFLTAIIAFVVALIFATVIYYGGSVAIFILVLVAAFFIIRTHIYQKKKEKEKKESSRLELTEDEVEREKITEFCSENVIAIITEVLDIYSYTLKALSNEKRKHLKKALKWVKQHDKTTSYLKTNINKILKNLSDDDIEWDYQYVQIIDYLREITHSIKYITFPSFDYVDNNHKPLINEQKEELGMLSNDIEKLFNKVKDCVANKVYDDEALQLQAVLFEKIEQFQKNLVKRIKNKEIKTKNSMLYLNLLSETKNMGIHIIHLYKSYRGFVNH